MLITERKNLKTVPLRKNVNKKLLPLNKVSIELFNEIYLKVVELEKAGEMYRFEWTDKGYIKKKRIQYYPAYNFRQPTKKNIELVILHKDGMCRLVWDNAAPDDSNKEIPAYKAFQKFLKICEEEGINLEDYAIDNGAEVKKEIEKPIIKLETPRQVVDKIWDNAHHVDFHCSHPAGMAESYPELWPVVDRLYAARKEDEIYKKVINITWGYMQSVYVGYRWANLSKAGMANTNRRMRSLTEALRENGNIILAYNTDGIWYVGDIYHGPGEGDQAGQWSNDHVNCRIRFKSAGAYEYIEDGVYTPVLRGRCNYDYVKPRSEWEWGDIYQEGTTPILYRFEEYKGIMEVVDNG